jgi:hypothetical protein
MSLISWRAVETDRQLARVRLVAERRESSTPREQCAASACTPRPRFKSPEAPLNARLQRETHEREEPASKAPTTTPQVPTQPTLSRIQVPNRGDSQLLLLLLFFFAPSAANCQGDPIAKLCGRRGGRLKGDACFIHSRDWTGNARFWEGVCRRCRLGASSRSCCFSPGRWSIGAGSGGICTGISGPRSRFYGRRRFSPASSCAAP